MAYSHPIGDDHPFRAVHTLAQAEGYEPLEIVDVYDGALIRLFCRDVQVVFKLEGDPGSAMDRQRFDYYTHVRTPDGTPEEILGHIKSRIAALAENQTGGQEETSK